MDVTAPRDTTRQGDQVSKEAASLVKNATVPAAAPVPAKVDAVTLDALYNYSLLAALTYSDDRSKVYTALATNASGLFQRILPAGKNKKDVQFAAKDKLVRVVLLADPAQPGGAEAVVTFVGPDDVSAYEPNAEYPIATPVRKLDSWPKDVPADDGVAVYGTFARAFNDLVKGKDDENLATEARKLASSLGVTITKITCVGHGTGGAFATIASFWLKKLTFPNATISCITFGAPRVGNAAFSKAFAALVANSFRVVHKTDPLTDVPSHLSFQHIPGGVLLYEPQHNDFGAPMLDDPCYVALSMESPSPLFSYLVEDNNILKYMEGLYEAARGRKIPNLAADIKTLWGGFQKSGWFSDNMSANEGEVRAIVKQLLRFQTDEVELASKSLLVKLTHYGTWAAASYCHLVSEAEMMLKQFYDEHAADADDFELPIPGTLRLVKGIGQRLPSIFLSTDTQALVGLLDDKAGGAVLVVAFRGSESNADWATNFDVPMTDAAELVPAGPGVVHDPRWKVHSGFTKSVKDIMSPPPNKGPLMGLSDGRSNTPVDKQLQPMKDILDIAEHLRSQAGGLQITRVVVCGHSLGGALSKLGAYWCQKVGFKDLPVENYSFGAPRVANWEFAQEWRHTVKTAWRVVHRADPVPAVPFSSWLGDLEYHHVNDPVLLCQPKIQNFLAPNFPDVPQKDSYQAQLRARPTPLTAMVKLTTTKDLEVAGSDHLMVPAYLPALREARKTLDTPLAAHTSLVDQVMDKVASVLKPQ